MYSSPRFMSLLFFFTDREQKENRDLSVENVFVQGYMGWIFLNWISVILNHVQHLCDFLKCFSLRSPNSSLWGAHTHPPTPPRKHTHTHTHTHTLDCYSNIKKEIPPFVTTWMDSEGIILRVKLVRQRQILYGLIYMGNLKKKKELRNREQIGWCQRCEDTRNR